MIDVITEHTARHFAAAMDSMFRLRHEVLVERMGWNLTSLNGLERDQFDNENAVYLLIQNDRHEVLASCRLTRSDKPNLLNDVFPFLVEYAPLPRSSSVWEVSRVVNSPCKDTLRSLPGCPNVGGALFCGMIEFGLATGSRHLVSVSDLRMERLLRLSGWKVERLGRPQRTSDTTAVAEIAEVSQAHLRSIRQATGVNGPVLDLPATELSKKAA